MSVGELSTAPALFLGSFSAGERTKVVLLSLHPHLFPVLVGVGVIQLVLMARPTAAAAVATVSKSGEEVKQEERGAGCRYVGYWISRGGGGHVGSRNGVRAGTLQGRNGGSEERLPFRPNI